MTCRDVIEFLMDYLAGALPDEERALFDVHLKVCPSCVAYLDSYRTTVALGKAAWAEAATKGIPEELVRAIVAARKEA